VTQGPKTRRLSYLAFVFYHILHCICFKYFLQNQNILFLNEVIFVWLEQSKKWKKLNIKFKGFCVIIILGNHYFIILKLFRAIRDFILYQIKQMAFKSGFDFTSYGKFMDTRWIKDLKTRKSLSPIWISSSISRKRQMTGFAPLHHICDHTINVP